MCVAHDSKKVSPKVGILQGVCYNSLAEARCQENGWRSSRLPIHYQCYVIVTLSRRACWLVRSIIVILYGPSNSADLGGSSDYICVNHMD